MVKTYKDLLHDMMAAFAMNPFVRFVGYNTAYGHKMNGTLVGCEALCIETPVAENLMVGVATGLALNGYLPILCFERSDFLLAGMDALVNHLSHLQTYGLRLPMVIRVCVGNDQPLNPGTQHVQDYSEFFEKYTKLPVYRLLSHLDIKQAFIHRVVDRPIITVEYRRLYDSLAEGV